MAQDAKEFRFQTPEFEGVKKTLTVCSSDLMKVQMQIVKDGGENNLHAHPDVESIWIVLKGRARFYGMNDVLVAELGPGEGVAIPKGVPYWFDNTEEEPLEIYHITSRDSSIKDVHRVNFAPYTDAQNSRGPRPGREATEEEKEAAAKL